MIVAASLHKTHIYVVKSLVKIAAISWHSLRRFIKPAPDDLFHYSDLQGKPAVVSFVLLRDRSPRGRTRRDKGQPRRATFDLGVSRRSESAHGASVKGQWVAACGLGESPVNVDLGSPHARCSVNSGGLLRKFKSSFFKIPYFRFVVQGIVSELLNHRY